MVVSFYPNEVGKGCCKSAYMPSGISGWGLSILVSVACSGVFVLPPGWDASPLQGYPQH